MIGQIGQIERCPECGIIIASGATHPTPQCSTCLRRYRAYHLLPRGGACVRPPRLAPYRPIHLESELRGVIRVTSHCESGDEASPLQEYAIRCLEDAADEPR